jgi:hypothetical protein
MGANPTIRDIYPEQWALVQQHFTIASPEVSDDMCESFLFRAMPRLKGVRETSVFYRIVKDELLYQLGQERLPATMVIERFSERLLELNRNSETDHISEKWNHRFRIAGFLLISIDLAYVLLMFVVPSGYSMGPFFLLLGLVIWLSPSFLGYYAIRRKPAAFFGPWHAILFLLSILLVIALMYAIVGDLNQLYPTRH